MSGLLSSIAGTAAGTAINSLFSGVLGNLQFNREKELLRNQQNFAYNMWKEQNSYNTPQAQMQRLLAAGISPTFAGQTVEGSYNSSVGSPSAKVPNLPSVSDSGIGSSLLSTQMQDEISKRNYNIQKESNEIARINANANEVVALKNAGLIDSQEAGQRLKNQYYEQQVKAEIAKTQAETAKYLASAAFDVSNKEYVDKTKEWVDTLNAAQVFEIRNGVAVKWAMYNLDQKRYQLLADQNPYIIDKLAAEAGSALAQGNLTKFKQYLQELTGTDNSSLFGSILSSIMNSIGKGVGWSSDYEPNSLPSDVNFTPFQNYLLQGK